VSSDPLQQNPGDIMLAPEVIEFCSEAAPCMGEHFTEEIQFSGKSARVARRLSRRTTEQVRPLLGCMACFLLCASSVPDQMCSERRP
jgi:hypothetical protein